MCHGYTHLNPAAVILDMGSFKMRTRNLQYLVLIHVLGLTSSSISKGKYFYGQHIQTQMPLFVCLSGAEFIPPAVRYIEMVKSFQVWPIMAPLRDIPIWLMASIHFTLLCLGFTQHSQSSWNGKRIPDYNQCEVWKYSKEDEVAMK